jgi:hypothetical protein
MSLEQQTLSSIEFNASAQPQDKPTVIETTSSLEYDSLSRMLAETTEKTGQNVVLRLNRPGCRAWGC